MIKRRYWKALSFFTHAGHSQIRRWITDTGVGIAYTDAEVKELVNFTSFIAVITALERARLGRDDRAIARISDLLPMVESD